MGEGANSHGCSFLSLPEHLFDSVEVCGSLVWWLKAEVLPSDCVVSGPSLSPSGSETWSALSLSEPPFALL